MFTEIITTVFFGLIFAVGFVVGMIYEHNRIMTKLEKATNENAEIKRCCGNCVEYDGDRCMLYWNNADKCYYDPDRDDKDPYDCCDYWQLDENALEDE